MKCYLKSASTFYTTDQKDTTDYDLVLDSIKGESGSVTILGDEVPASMTGSWLILNGDPYKISEASPSKGKTKLKLMPFDTLFDRKLLYEADNSATIGGYMAGIITSEWKNQSDPVFAAPYISVTNTDTTPFVAPETDEKGIFNFLEYARKMRQDYGVTISAEVSLNTLVLTISAHTPVVRPLVLDDGHTQLIQADFSNKAKSKLTVYIAEETGRDADDNPIYTVTESIYYLAADGTVSDTVPADRAAGEWGSITIGQDDDPLEKATEEFGKNESSHKVEFFSAFGLEIGDKVRMKLHGEIFESTVTGIYRKKSDSRTRYKLGDLPTTLSEKMEKLEQPANVTVIRSGGGGEVLPAWQGGSY